MYHSTEKQIVEERYGSFLDSISSSIQDINGIQGANKNLEGIIEQFRQLLSQQFDESKKIFEDILQAAEWDKLVIAFIGETGAGKSTIIETFRILFREKTRQIERDAKGHGTDGIIVGDGQSDYTKYCTEYQLSVNGKPFVLIDVPGIQGEESEYREEIFKALSKAHCVFYVLHEDFDSAIAEKVKSYLKDWGKVYAVYSVRGSSSQFSSSASRESFLTADVLRMQDIIDKHFKRILSDKYGGIIPLIGLFGLCAVADFDPSKGSLLKTQQRLLKPERFADSHHLFQFSRFQDLVDLVDMKSENFKQEIIEANKEKLKAQSEVVIDRIDQRIKVEQDETDRYRKRLKKFKKDITSCYRKSLEEIEYDIESAIDKSFDNYLVYTLRLIADDDTSSDEKKKRVNNYMKRLKSTLTTRINEIFDKDISKLNQSIEEKRKELNPVNAFGNTSIGGLNDIYLVGVSSAFDSIGFKWKDAGNMLLDVGGWAAAGSFGGVIGIAIGAGLGFIINIIKYLSGDRGKGKANQKVRAEIEKNRAAVKSSLGEMLRTVFSPRFNESMNNAVAIVDKEYDRIESLSKIIENLQYQILDILETLNNKDYGSI